MRVSPRRASDDAVPRHVESVARPNLEARAAAQSSPRRAATSERTAGSTSRVNAAFALARERGAARRALPPRPLRAANARGSRRDDDVREDVRDGRLGAEHESRVEVWSPDVGEFL